MEDNWESLSGALPQLSLSERSNANNTPAAAAADSSAHASDITKPPTPPTAEGNSSQHQVQGQQQTATAHVPEYEAVDAAIRQALADPTQRVTVIKCEELVEKFLADNCQETLQFPASFTSYQRMLAHRIGQYYGLQTSTVDYEDSQGRVVAIRLKSCYEPKPRLRDMDIRSDPVAQRVPGANGFVGADKPRLLRRQDEDRSQLNSSEHSLNQSPVRSIKERQENYMKAREEILGSGPHDGGMGRGGRGGPGGRFGTGGRMDGGRGRKAVFRDKDKELSDPDYRRGMNRFSGAARFDPAYATMPAGGIYQVPTYSSEFPVLGRMTGGGPVQPVRPMHMSQQPLSQQQPQQPQQQAAHAVAPGGQPHPMSGHAAHQSQAGAHGPWGQQAQQQGPGGVRPPPPPPPPHQHVGGPSNGPAGGANGAPGGKAHQNSAGGSGGPPSGAMGGRHQQQQQQQQATAAYGPTMATSPYHSAVATQYPVPMAVGTGFVPAAAGQHVFGVATPGGTIPGAMYAAPAHGVGGATFYPGMGVGMGAVGMAVPATGAYGYVAAPAPGMGMGMSSTGEAIAITPQAAYPVYASYPAYPAAASMHQAASIHHPAGTAAIPMRPVYGIPSFYPQYDPSQYAAGAGAQHHGEGRGGHAGGGYGGHHHHGGGGQQHHGSGGAGAHGHGHSGGRTRDSDNGVGRGEQQQSASSGVDAK